MSEAAESFYLRPIFTIDQPVEIISCIGSQLLLRLDLNEYFIGRIEQNDDDDGLVLSSPLPLGKFDWYSSKWLTFMDSRTICRIAQPKHACFFIVIRAADDFFQEILEMKKYRLNVSDFIDDIQVLGQNAYLSTSKCNTREVIDTKLWNVQIPHQISSTRALQILPLGQYEPENRSYLRTSTTNGRLHVGELYHYQERQYQNIIRNLRTGRDHVISGVENDSIQLVDDVAIRWTFSRSDLGLAVCRLDDDDRLTLTDYSAPLPLPERELDKEWSKETHVNIDKTGKRFFLTRNNVILMGYFPGVDVSLEDVAAAEVWRSLPPCAQEDLLSKNLLSKRQILLRAMKEEEKRRNGRKDES